MPVGGGLDQTGRNVRSKRFTRLSTTAPIKAGRKRLILKPGTTAAASSNMSALMTHQNNPKVRIVNGNVTTLRGSQVNMHEEIPAIELAYLHNHSDWRFCRRCLKKMAEAEDPKGP